MHVHGRSGRAYVQVCGKSSGKARPARARAYARVSAAGYNLPLTVFTTGRAHCRREKKNNKKGATRRREAAWAAAVLVAPEASDSASSEAAPGHRCPQPDGANASTLACLHREGKTARGHLCYPAAGQQSGHTHSDPRWPREPSRAPTPTLRTSVHHPADVVRVLGYRVPERNGGLVQLRLRSIRCAIGASDLRVRRRIRRPEESHLGAQGRSAWIALFGSDCTPHRFRPLGTHL